ncbi:hypothetical protein HHI36_021940 [Cryptolaemus montrouzieri]|uniref:Uncharacterized protein n=1 Tax=Cryptolaemus montrouzieri TaxID=559131 RepID=A0ABD2MYK9_9CUCU
MFLFDKIDTVPFWKKIYQTASGYSPSVTCDIVDEILTVTSSELKGGYSIYETYSEEEFLKWEKTITEKDNDLNHFVRRLCKCLNLKPKVALPVFFNYLMFEYYGKIEDIKNLILYEHSVLSLLENVWHFYSSERMYYIKTLRHIFECATRSDSPFKNEYIKFIKSLNITEFRKKLISELKSLINEITEVSLENSFDRKNYVNRNNREQLEFILLIVMTMEYKEISTDEFSGLFENFLLHNFTRQPVYFDATLFGDPMDFDDVKTAEIGCFIIGIHQIGGKINTLPGSVETSLKNIQNQGNHKIVLFSWVLAKLKTFDESESELISSYENLLRILIEGQTFMSVAEFLSSKLIKAEIRAAKLIQAGVFKLLDEFLVAIDMKNMLVENEGLINCLVHLMEDPEIAQECTTARGGLDTIVKMVFEQFPVSFLSLTKFCQVLVRHDGLAKVVISKLSNLMVNSVVDGSSLDTPFYNDSSKYAMNYFLYLAQITRKLCENPNELDEKVLHKMLLGFELICEIVNYYDGNITDCGFSNCLVLLDQFVNIHGTSANFAPFVKIYFNIHAMMVLHQNSTIQQEFQRLKMPRQFLPRLQTREKIPEVLMQRHIIDSLLLQILRKEEYETKHSTIKAYLDLILHCVSTNSDAESIQIPGLIYMMSFVFPYHKNWQYSDIDDQVEISVLCLKIMLEVLNRKTVKNEDILKNFYFILF